MALRWDHRLLWREGDEPRRHAEIILPMVDALLREAGAGLAALDAIAVSRGPGSFTGVRVAVATAQGLALAAGVTIVPVSTLATVVRAAWERHRAVHVLAALDARMNEVYWCTGNVDEAGRVTIGPEQVSPPERLDIPPHPLPWFPAGPGWAVYAGRLPGPADPRLQAGDSHLEPHARYVLPLAEQAVTAGETVPATGLEPVYLRDEVARKKHRAGE